MAFKTKSELLTLGVAAPSGVMTCRELRCDRNMQGRKTSKWSGKHTEESYCYKQLLGTTPVLQLCTGKLVGSL